MQGHCDLQRPSQGVETNEFHVSPSREAAPSERPSCRLKAFLKCVQFVRKHGSGLGARALACAPGTFNCAVNTERGSPCKGWAKKILPEEKRKVEIFFRPACEALAGGKKAFKAARKRTPLSRPHTHNCPGTLYRSRYQKMGHWNRG